MPSRLPSQNLYLESYSSGFDVGSGMYVHKLKVDHHVARKMVVLSLSGFLFNHYISS
jgi:hypothetical protein